MAPPRLTRRGEAQRISEWFARVTEGQLTTVDGVSALRHRLLNLCITGDGGIDWTGVAALKTHVGLHEALELEDIKCAAGDARHEFQERYPKYLDWRKRQRARETSDVQVDALNPAVAAEELAMYKQAIRENEELLADHRAAVLANKPSPFSDSDVDQAHALLEQLRRNLPVLELAIESELGDG